MDCTSSFSDAQSIMPILLANHPHTAGVCMGNGTYSFHFVYSPEGVGHYLGTVFCYLPQIHGIPFYFIHGPMHLIT